MKLLNSAFLSACLTMTQFAVAELDESQRQGVTETQNLMRSKTQRQEFIKKDKAAKEVDQKVEALTGPGQNKEEVYDIATKIFEKVASEANGDAAKMQTLLQEAQKNPQGFYDKYFSAEEKARVRGLARDIEKTPAALPKK